MHNKPEKLPIGHGDPNTSIGGMVNNFGHIESKIAGKVKANGTVSAPMKPSAAFDSSGFVKKNKEEYETPIAKRADDITDPAELKSYLSDVKYSADMDWPGGRAGEFEKWDGVRSDIVDIGENPGKYTPADVDKIIEDFHGLDAPSTVDLEGNRIGHPIGDDFPKAPKGYPYSHDGFGNPEDMPDLPPLRQSRP